MYDFLGQVALARQETEEAAAYFDHSVDSSVVGQWKILEGFARKDRALCCLADRQIEPAREQLDLAAAIFDEAGFGEGMAHVNRARGILLRLERQWGEAEKSLRRALQHFEMIHEKAEVARTRLEMARLQKVRGAPKPLIRDEFLVAVMSAEQSRRPHLVQEADRELSLIDPTAGAWHIYRRVRGHRIDGDSTSLTSAEQDVVTVFFFDLQGFTEWSRQTDPSVVMLCLNQMMATFWDATQRHDIQVIEYMGDGFLALSRGPSHARRAVEAAIDLYTALEHFNRPRRSLGLSEFTCRVGISTGEVVLGNVGTYEKIDYRAIGTTVNLAARIQNEAIPGGPCVSQTTWESVDTEFECQPNSPRTVILKGLGDRLVFDISARRPKTPSQR